MTHAPAEQSMAIATMCLDHLRREEFALRLIRESLNDLNSTLRGQSQDSLENALARFAATAAEFNGLTPHRDALRRRLAAHFQVPDNEISIGRVTRLLPEPEARIVSDAHVAVKKLTDETRALSRRTTAILNCCKTFTGRLLAEICGPERAVDRYGPSGSRCSEFALARSAPGVM